MKKKKSKKEPFVDDGHTVYSMEGLESPLRRDKRTKGLTKKERFAAIRAAYLVYLPRLLAVIACFGVVCLLLYFWLYQ